MRRLVFASLASAALLAIGPAGALARDGHHSRSHHRVRHARVHIRHFGTRDVAGAPSGDTAGTVAEFKNGFLTLTLNDGSRVRGRVTDATEMECTAGMSTMSREDGGSGGDQGDQGDQGDRGDQGDQGDRGDQGDQGDQGDDHGDGGATCSQTALHIGTVVTEAELKISSAGAVWDKLELVTP